MKIFFFGGTFDPPHIGHEKIVNYCINKSDKFILMPNRISPDKMKFNKTSWHHRLRMLQILFNDTKITIDKFEIDNNEISYTFKTVEYLKNKYKGSNLTMIIGYDQYKNLCNWYKYEEIIKEVNIICFNREGFDSSTLIKKNLKIEFVENFYCDISSEYIRKNYSNMNNENRSKYLNNRVVEYIGENHLYES